MQITGKFSTLIQSLRPLAFRTMVAGAKSSLLFAAAIALSVLFSIQTLIANPTDLKLVIQTRQCAATLDTDMARWLEAQRASGVSVSYHAEPLEHSATAQSHELSYSAIPYWQAMKGPPGQPPLLKECVIGSYKSHYEPQRKNVFATLIMVLPLQAAIAVLFIAMRLIRRRPILLLDKRPATDYIVSAGIGIALSIASALVIETAFHYGLVKPGQFPNAEMLLDNGILYAVAILVGGAAIFEEILFRGMLLRPFIAAQLPRLGAVFVSSWFATVHLTAVRDLSTLATGFAVYFGGSLVLCAIYLRSRNIVCSMLCHACMNLAALALTLAAG